MFDKEYAFKGKHADMVRDLTKEFNMQKNKFFPRNYDVYLLAPIIGFLYQRKAAVDQTKGIEPTKIWGDMLINNIDDLQFNYRLIMLLDRDSEPDPEKRIEKAFRGNNTPEDEALYESYVRGGVEVLYEKLMEGVDTSDGYTSRLFDFLEEFDARYSHVVDMDQVLELCRKARA